MYPCTVRLTTPTYKVMEFTFRRIFRPGGHRFGVTGIEPGGREHRFEMILTPDKGWRIVNAPRVDDWLLKMEWQLAQAIGELPEPPVQEGI